MRLTQGAFSYLPDLTDEQIRKQVDYCIYKNWAVNIEYTEDPIVSIDINGNTHSCIFDAQMTSVIGNMVKIVGWYDNETGYSSRILELICNLSDKTSLLSNK